MVLGLATMALAMLAIVSFFLCRYLRVLVKRTELEVAEKIETLRYVGGSMEALLAEVKTDPPLVEPRYRRTWRRLSRKVRPPPDPRTGPPEVPSAA